MNITLELLRAVYRECPVDRLHYFIEPLNAACEAAEINTRARLTAFLAQAGVESRELRDLEENLNYSAAGLVGTWSSRFWLPSSEQPTCPAGKRDAREYERKPQAIANYVYGGRFGNGPEESGDGWRFRGRGIFQITFRENYAKCSAAIAGDAAQLVDHPEYLTDPDYACMSAAWYWGEHNLNRWADIGDFDTLTQQINAAKLELPQRVAFWKRGLEALA